MTTVFKGTNNPDNISGTSHNDTIYGYGAGDTLKGLGGDDWLKGGDGNDTLVGGTGFNDYWGGSGDDTFVMSTRNSGLSDDLIHDFTFGQDKADVLKWGISDFGQIKDLLYTGNHGEAAFNAFYDGFDHVLRFEGVGTGQLQSSDFTYSTSGPVNATGTQHADVMFGSSGDDTLSSKGGADLLLGGAGNDTLNGGFGLDDYDGGKGTDTVTYFYSNEIVDVYLGKGQAIFGDGTKEFLTSIENVTGSTVSNWLNGDSGANMLVGLDGSDRLKGMGGNDTLEGDKGADHLFGGMGDDIFVYAALSDSTAAGSGRDTVGDFHSGDQFDLTQLETATGESFTFIGNSSFSGTAGEVNYHVNSKGDTIVGLDSDGDGKADFAIALTGSHTLASGGFIL